jgi:enoyl-CoA hydratase
MAQITSERHDTTAVIKLDNPDAFNALAPNMITEFTEALQAAGVDRTCRAVVITGIGQRAFCAGIDVKSVAKRDNEATTGSGVDPIEGQFENLHYNLGGMIRAIHSLPIPVIAAVNGHAIGAGFALAAASDIRIASESVKFADGFVSRGISGCEMGLSYFLPRLVGAAAAFEWMLSGRRIEADEAVRTGLVSRVTSGDELLAHALALANDIAQNAPLAISLTKEVMWSNLHAGSLDQALALESRTQIMARNTADAAEARQAFLEKRPPVFGTPDQPRRLR